MTLTQEDLKELQAPFALDDHEFINGYVYIREDAITARIEQIDPAWGLIQSDYVIIDGQYNVSVNLVIKGVTRVGIGTAQAIFKNERLVNEPLKSAVTDALKRSARLFGIGRYLLQAPKEQQFARWLAGLSGGQPANVQRTSPKPEARRVPPQATPAQDSTRRDVLLVEAIKETKEGQKGEIQFYRFKVEGQKSDDYTVSCFCWQFVEWSGLKSLKDASAYDEATGVYTPINPIPAQIEQSGNFWNVVSVPKLARS